MRSLTPSTDANFCVTSRIFNVVRVLILGAIALVSTNLFAAAQTVSTRSPAANAVINTTLPSIQVTFGGSVSGMTAAKLTVSSTAGTFAATTVTPAGPTAGPYTFSGYSTPADGTVTVALAASGGNSNADWAASTWTYTKDTVAPTCSSITRAGTSPTNGSSLSFTVTFSEAVTGVTAANFSKTGTLSATGTIGTPTTTNNITWTVPVTGVTGSGTFGIDKTSNTGIADTATNAATGVNVTGALYTVDQTAPTCSSITLAGTSPTNASSLSFTVTFSEAVTGVTAANFSKTGTLSATGTIGTPTTSNNITWTVPVTGVTGSGTFGINKTSNTGIADTATNAATGGNVTGALYTVDQTAPTCSSITLAGTSPTNSSSLSFTVTFSEAVTGVSVANFSKSGTLSASGTIGTPTTSDNITWTVPITSVTGSGTFGIDKTSNTGVTDSVGNSLSGGNVTGALYTVDQTAPTCSSITRADISPTNASSFSFTVTFSEAVTGVSAANFSKTGTLSATGSIGTPTTSDNITWTVPVTGVTGSGTFGIDKTSNAGIADSLGNGLSGGNVTGALYTVDQTAPTVLTRSPSSAASINSLGSVDVTFSESVTGVAAGDLTVNGNAATSILGSGAGPYSFSGFASPADGTVNLVLAASAIKDSVSNGFAGSSWTYTKDSTAPTATVTGPASPTNSNPINFTMNFSKSVSGLAVAGITVTNGTKGSLSGSGSGPYTLPVTPSGQGAVTCQVNAGAAMDAFGNGNSVSNNLSITFDSVSPTVSTQSPADTSNINALASVQVTFSETVTGVAAGDLTVNGSAATSVSGSGPYTFSGFSAPSDGNVSVAIAAGLIKDSANNAFAGSSWSYTKDSTQPSAIVTGPASPTNNNPISFTINFSKSVSGLAAAGITVTGGTKGALSGSGSGPYTMPVTPSGQGAVTCQVTAGAATDDFGNTNSVSNNLVITYDSVSPTVSSQSPSASANINALASVQVTFSETVSGPVAGDLTVNGSAATSISGSGAGPYTFSGFTAPADGTVNISLAAGSIKDGANNAFAGSSWSYTKDSTQPTATVTGPASPTNSSPVSFTINFGKSVTGLTAAGITVTGGTKGSLTGSGTGPYSIPVTPSGQGAVTCQVNAGAATDAFGNSNSVSNNLSITYDSVTPSVSSTTPSNDANINALASVSVTFSETVTGVAAGDLTVNAIAATSISGSGAGPYVFSGFTAPADGGVSVVLAAGSTNDAAGNGFSGSSWSYTKDSTQPTVIVTGPGANSSASPMTFFFNFTKSVTGFTAGGVSVTNGTKGTFSGSGSGPYSLDVTPSAQGAVTVQVSAGVAADVFGNTNSASSLYTSVFDTVAPTISSRVPAANANINDLTSVQVTFSESVTGVAAGDLTVNGNAATSLSGSGSGPYTFSGFSTPADGTVNVAVAGGSTQDAAGNAFSGDSWSYTKNSTQPTATVTGPASPTNSNPINFTINFNRSISGLAVGGVTVTGGTKGTLSGSGAGPYTLPVTPTAQGAVTCQVNAGAATDVYGNTNSVSNNLSITYDSTAPTVQSTTPAGNANINALSTVQVTFSESVSNVAAADLTVNGSAASSLTGSGAGPYVFSGFVAPADGTVNVVIGAGSISDDAGNAFSGSSWSYTKDSVAPTASVTAPADPTSSSPLNFTINFSKSVSGFTAAAITVTGGTKGILTGSGSGPYIIPVTPTGQGLITCKVEADAGTDVFGNTSSVSNTASVTFDSVAPSVLSQFPGATATINSLTTVGVTFSETVTGVVAADLMVNGSAATSVSGSGAGPYVFSGYAAPADGPINVIIGAGATQDAAGNSFPGDSWGYTVDSQAVTVTVTGPASPTNSNPINFTLNFSKSVTGLTVSGITVTGGTKGSLSGTGAGPYTLPVTPGGQGAVTCQVDAGAAQDNLGNLNVASNDLSIIFDSVAPTVQSQSPATGSNINTLTSVLVAFSEAVTTVSASDLTVNGSAAIAISGSGAGPYVFSGFAAPADGTVNVVLGSGSIADDASNAFAGDSWSYTKDSIAPAPTVTAPSSPSNSSPLSFSITFDKSVSGLTTAGLSISNGTIASLSGSGSGPYTASVTPLADGAVTIQVTANSATDIFGNGNSASNVANVTYDSTAPSVLSVVPSESSSINSLASIAVTFSESVSGVAAADLTVNGNAATSVSGSGAGPYTFSGYSAPGDGTVNVNLSPGAIQDEATNAFAGHSWSYTLDQTAPTVSSITRADANPTSATSVNFTVNFSESVSTVTQSNFTVVGLGSVTSVSGSGSVWTVTVGSIAGSGSVHVDLDADLGSISDSVGNPLSVAFTTGQTYTIDQTVPSVNSIVRADSNPTSATAVNFTVTFSEAVTGVGLSNFTVVGTGVTGNVSSISGSAASYTLTVSSVTGNGSLRLDLDSNLGSVLDSVGNPLSAGLSGESYTVDQTAPTVTSITRADTDPTSATSVQFTVVLSENVSDLVPANFSVSGSGVSGSVTAVVGSGSTWTVTVASVAGDGSLRVDLDTDLPSVIDAAGNPMTAAFTGGEACTVDQTAPTVTSITLADTDPTSATALNFSVNFSESVTGVDVGNFSLSGSGVTANIASVTGSTMSWTVTVNNVAGNGSLGINLDQNLAGIIDAVGNAVGSSFTGPTYSVDQEAPTVTSITRADTNPTSATTVAFNVTFAEDVTGVSVANFSAAGSGVTGTVNSVTGAGSSWQVTVTSVSGNGTLRVDLDQDLDSIRDIAFNPVQTSFITGETYTIDQTAPTVVSVARADGNPTNATTVNFTVTFSEAVSGLTAFNFGLTGSGVSAAIGAVTGGGTTWNVVVNGVAGTGTLGLDLTSNSEILDAAFNKLSNAPFTGELYDVDQTAPTILSIVRTDANPTSATTVNFSLHFSEPVTGLTAANLGLSGTGVTSTIGAVVNVDGTTWTVAVTSVSGNGTLGLDLTTTASIQDGDTNPLANTLAGEQYDIDQTAPTVSALVRVDANPTSATTLNFKVTFSEPVTGFTSAALTLSGTGVTGIINAPASSDGGLNWNVTLSLVTGSGTLGIDLFDPSGILDVAGNELAAGFNGEQYTVDQANPQVLSITATDANPTSATTVNYLVTFTKSVSGVTSSSFALVLSGVSADIGIPSVVSGNTWNVPVINVTGTGTVRLDLVDPTGIVDAFANPLIGTPATGDVYTIDQTAPTVLSIVRNSSSPTNATTLGFTVTFSEAVTTLTAANLTMSGSGVTANIQSITTSDQLTWTITLNNVSGSGNIGLDLTSPAGIYDAVGNPLAGTPVTGPLYVVDQDKPIALTLLRTDVNPTSATTLGFVLTFNEPVTGVTSASLSLSGAGVVGTINDPVTTDGITWSLTVSSVAGNGTLGLDVSNISGIADLNGNQLASGITGQLYTVDQTAPLATSITRMNANPTSATVVNFLLSFSEAVSGVTTANFTFSGTSVTAVLGTPFTSDGGFTWSVSATAVTGTGLLGLDLSDPTGVADAVGNPLSSSFTGQQYSIDQTNPLPVSLTRANANPTSATAVQFTLTFSEAVTGLTSNSLSLLVSGTTATLGDPATTNGLAWTIPVTSISGSGTLAVDLTTTAGIYDVVGNPLFAGVAGQTYTIDNIPPVVVSITRLDANPNPGPTLRFSVNFSEAVTGLTAANLTVSTIGTATGAISSVLAVGAGAAWEVTLTGVSGQGNIGIVISNASGIYDLAGNPLALGPYPNLYYDISPCSSPAQATSPQPSNGSVASTTLAQLSWTSGTAALAFNVYLDGNLLGATSTTAIALTQPLAAGVHNWRVDSDSGCGLITTGATWTFTVLNGATGPVSPTDGALLCSSPTRLEWGAAAGATVYAIYVDDVFAGSSVANTYFDLPAPLPEGPHTWRVDAGTDTAIVQGPVWRFVILSVGLINPSVWRTDGQVYAVVSGPGVIYIAGNFTYVLSPNNATWKPRSYIAAIDTATGQPTDFDPKANAPVYALALQGNTLFAGGMFTTMNGLARQRLAAVDITSSASVLSWNPGANGTVRALLANSSRLYAGGDFSITGGQSRGYLAAFDTITTSSPTLASWAPAVSNSVYALAASGNDVYVGGIFQSAGGQPLHGVAALDSSTGLAHTWPGAAADLYVYALAVRNNRLYIGGQFNSMGGVARGNLACIDPLTGEVFAWNPIADRSVSALLIDGNTVYAGGAFTQIGTEQHIRLAGIHMITGATIACDYDCNNVVRALGSVNNTLYAGGDFSQVSSSSANGFAAIGPLTTTTTTGVSDWMLYNK